MHPQIDEKPEKNQGENQTRKTNGWKKATGE